MKKIKLAIVLFLSLILVLLVVQNTGTVQTYFLGYTAEMSLVVLLFLTGGIGFASGLVLGFLIKSKGAKSIEEQQSKQ